MTTPERDTVTRAREAVLETMLEGNDSTIEYYPGPESHKWLKDRERCQRENAEALDTLEAAILAEVIAVVERMKHTEVQPNMVAGGIDCDHARFHARLVTLHEVLTAIRALTEAR